MTLTTLSSSTSASSRVSLAGSDLYALACAASAGVHGALVVPHAHESTALAVAFLVSTLALVAAALGEALAPAMSRTTGIPGLTEEPEPFDTLGSAISVLEVAAALPVVVRLSNRRRHP